MGDPAIHVVMRKSDETANLPGRRRGTCRTCGAEVVYLVESYESSCRQAGGRMELMCAECYSAQAQHDDEHFITKETMAEVIRHIAELN